MKRIFVLLLIVLLLAGCAPADTTQEGVTTSSPLGRLERIIDKEAGVVCWFYARYETGAALDCMPISNTRLNGY